jgi:hypothetical protein
VERRGDEELRAGGREGHWRPTCRGGSSFLGGDGETRAKAREAGLDQLFHLQCKCGFSSFSIVAKATPSGGASSFWSFWEKQKLRKLPQTGPKPNRVSTRQAKPHKPELLCLEALTCRALI